MIRFLLWDADGTLFDTYPALVAAMGSALRSLGKEAQLDRIDKLCKQSMTYCIETLAGEFGLESDVLLGVFDNLYSEISSLQQPPFPDVIKLCEYVISIGGGNYVVTHRGKASLERLLEVHQMEHLFADAITAADDFPRKPDPASFAAMVTRHNLPLSESLGIGDRELDIVAAHGAGLRTCFFGANSHTFEPDFKVADYGQFYDIIQAENGI